MTVASEIQNITFAECISHGAGEFHAPFDVVKIKDKSGSHLDLFLPVNTGQAIADAINAAVKPADEVTK